MRKSQKYTVLCLLSINILLACSKSDMAPVVEPTIEATPITTAEILPGSKGPRLEVTTIDGEFVIPAGTELDLTDTSLVASIQHLLIPPAYAANALSKEDLKQFQATIDDEPADIEIINSRIDSETGDQIVSYRLVDVEESEDQRIVEISIPERPFKVQGLINKIEKEKVNKLAKLDLETTLLITYVRQILTEKDLTLKKIPRKELQKNLLKVKRSQEFKKFKEQIRKEYKDPKNKKVPFHQILDKHPLCDVILAGHNETAFRIQQLTPSQPLQRVIIPRQTRLAPSLSPAQKAARLKRQQKLNAIKPQNRARKKQENDARKKRACFKAKVPSNFPLKNVLTFRPKSEIRLITRAK